jgi:hypothetical protein
MVVREAVESDDKPDMVDKLELESDRIISSDDLLGAFMGG